MFISVCLLFLWFHSIFNLLYDRTALLNTDEMKHNSVLGNTFLVVFGSPHLPTFGKHFRQNSYLLLFLGVDVGDKKAGNREHMKRFRFLNLISLSFLPLPINPNFTYLSGSCKISDVL